MECAVSKKDVAAAYMLNLKLNPGVILGLKGRFLRFLKTPALFAGTGMAFNTGADSISNILILSYRC